LELKELFGTSLRQCRRARRLTQAQLAEAAGLSLEMIGRLERGITGPSLETIAALAETLKVAPAELFGARSTVVDSTRSASFVRISKLLAAASDADLKRAERVLAALLAG
jgi:transcriptional regulator with XRE-family HTH domain